MEKPTFNNLVGNFGESLGKLDGLLSELKGHPMYSEWLEIDEVSVLSALLEDDDDADDDQSDYQAECQYADLLDSAIGE